MREELLDLAIRLESALLAHVFDGLDRPDVLPSHLLIDRLGTGFGQLSRTIRGAAGDPASLGLRRA